MTADDGGVQHAEPDRGTLTPSRWALHVVGYLVLLVALLAVTDLHDGWNLDDGAYASQVAVLRQTGSWAYPYRHRDVDPTSRFAPISLATTTASATYPYVKLPAWITVLRWSTAVFGPVVGLYVPALLGAVVAALLAGLLAERLEPRAGPLGFWTVALGPIVVHTQAMWAHTAAAALGAGCALVVVALAQGRARPWHPWLLAALVGSLCAIRGEGLLYAAAMAVTVAAVVLVIDRRSPVPASPLRVLLESANWAGPVLLVALAVKLVDVRWSAHLAPGASLASLDPTSSPGFASARVSGATRTLLDGVGASHAGTFLAVVVLVLALASGIALRRGQRTMEGLVLLGGAVVVVVVRAVVAPDDMGGLVVALPIVVSGITCWGWRRAALAEQALGGLCVLFGAAVLATQYPEGGNRDWGGRFLFPVLVPLIALALVSLRRSLTIAEGPLDLASAGAVGTTRLTSRVVCAALLVLVAVPTLAGLHTAAVARASSKTFTALTLNAQVPTVVRIPRYLTRTSWRALPEADWLSANVDNAAEALAALRPDRTEPVAVIGNGADRVRAPGYRRHVRSPVVVIFTPD